MGYLLSRSIMFFFGNIRSFWCLRPEWPQGLEVCSYLGFESAVGVRCSPLRLSVCSCGRSRGYWVPTCAHESL